MQSAIGVAACIIGRIGLLTKVLTWLRPARSLEEERAAGDARGAANEAKLDARMSPNERQLRRDLTR
jgi:hypothetical protein